MMSYLDTPEHIDATNPAEKLSDTQRIHWA